MMRQTKRWLEPPIFPDNEDKTRKAQILYVLQGGILAFLLLATLGTLFIFVNKALSLAIVFILFVSVLVVYGMALRGHVLAASRLFVSELWIVFSLSLLLTGRFNTTFVSLHLAVVVMAGVLLGRRSAIFFSLLSILFGLGLTTLDIIGYPLVHYFPATPLTSWFVWVISFVQILTPLTPTIQNIAQSAAALREKQRFIESILAATPDFVHIYDLQEPRIVFSSRSIIASLGYTPEEIQAMGDAFMKQLLHPEDCAQVSNLHQRWKNARDGEVLMAEYRMRTRSGEWRWFLGRDMVFQRGADGKVRQIIDTMQDITEQKRTEEQLRKLSRAVEAAPVTVVITDKDGHIEYANPFFTRITGYALEEVLGKNPKVLKSNLTPSDLYPQLWKTILNGKNWEGEFINRKKNGELYTELALISPIYGIDGSIAHFVAIKQDITQRKIAEKALSASEARYRALFDQTHDAVFILDFEGHHLMVNQRAADMLGYTLDELSRLSVNDTSAEISQGKNSIARLLAGEHIPLYEQLFRKKNGEIFPVEINVELVKDENGKPLHIQSTVRDITKRKRMEDELQRLARTDPLTKLMNRRQFFELAEKEFVKSRRYHRPLAVILLDLDLFKEVNDTYGHLAGDQALIHVGDLLRNKTRETDIVARYGGEEFILLLPETDPSGACALAEHLCRKVEATSLEYENTTITVTISVGIAGKESHANVVSLDQVISQADKALYEAKRKGKNRVVCSH